MTLPKLQFPDQRGFLAFAIVGLLAFAIYARVSLNLPENDPLVSVIHDAFLIVVGWYFGSSKGSAAKDATIAQMKSPDPAPPVAAP